MVGNNPMYDWAKPKEKEEEQEELDPISALLKTNQKVFEKVDT